MKQELPEKEPPPSASSTSKISYGFQSPSNRPPLKISRSETTRTASNIHLAIGTSLEDEIAELKTVIKKYRLMMRDPTITSAQYERLHATFTVEYDNLTKLILGSRRNAQCEASLGIQFKEVPPQAIANEKLHERLDASKDLAMHLLNSSGRRFTPICDNMFGSGKTSLVYKFRTVLNSVDWPQRPADYESLRCAVYLHIPFTAKLVEIITSSRGVVHWILAAVRDALTSSCRGRADFLGEDMETFQRNMKKEVGTTKFLFHFDDVGCFEPLGIGIGAKFIYKLWEVGDAFRRDGHFFVMTGRSTLLHLIGTGQLKSLDFSSPDRTVIIPLPPLSKSAVEEINVEFGVERVLDQAEAIRALTGGIPRAVYAVVTFFKMNSTAVTVEKSIDSIMESLEMYCAQPMMHFDRSFQRCLELSWAGISFTNDSMINGEPITSMIARLKKYSGRIWMQFASTAGASICVDFPFAEY